MLSMECNKHFEHAKEYHNQNELMIGQFCRKQSWSLELEFSWKQFVLDRCFMLKLMICVDRIFPHQNNKSVYTYQLILDRDLSTSFSSMMLIVFFLARHVHNIRCSSATLVLFEIYYEMSVVPFLCNVCVCAAFDMQILFGIYGKEKGHWQTPID